MAKYFLPGPSVCYLLAHTEDEAVKTLLGSMDKTASGQARFLFLGLVETFSASKNEGDESCVKTL